MQKADADAISAAVTRFLDRVLADRSLDRYWIGVDEARLRRHARLFIVQALGGPQLYEGDMAEAHRSLAIDDDDFDRVAAELVVSLREAGVSADVQALALHRIDELRPVIVTS